GKRAGARQVVLVEGALSAAIGAALPVHEPVGNLIVDIGGGTTEFAVVSMGGVVDGRAISVGGFDLDAAIQEHVRERYDVVIGDKTAERIKFAIGSAYPTAGGIRAVRVRGREASSGGPKDLELTEDEIREAMSVPVREIVEAARATLAEAPPELTHDVLETGMFLAGGGGLLRGMDMLLAQECEVSVHLTEQPLFTVIRGAGVLLEDLAAYRSTLQLQRT
ncbi:MAG: rod shape-determining protein, partial [Actinomycetota bacterium]